jgi:hypothetical protein
MVPFFDTAYGGRQGDSIHRMMFGREQDSDCLNE